MTGSGRPRLAAAVVAAALAASGCTVPGGVKRTPPAPVPASVASEAPSETQPSADGLPASPDALPSPDAMPSVSQAPPTALTPTEVPVSTTDATPSPTGSSSSASSGLAPAEPGAAKPVVPFDTTPRLTPGASVVDVAYAPDGTPSHRLDLYAPATPGPWPVVLFSHGGAWAFGGKTMRDGTGYGALRDTLLAHGVAVASAQYRSSATDRFPAQLHDVRAAVRYLRGRASELGVDPERIATIGDSAGGHLGLLTALAPESSGLEGNVGVTGVSSRTRAAVALYAPTDLANLTEDRAAMGCGLPFALTTVLVPLLGGDPEGAGADAARVASPTTYADANATPLLLLHGSRDCFIPPHQSQRLADARRAAGLPVKFHTLDAQHDDGAFYTREVLEGTVWPFLEQALR